MSHLKLSANTIRLPPKRCLLSIIIVNYNVKELLIKCLLSIQDQNFSDKEIIVVDNHSDDGSCEVIRQEFPEVKLVCNEQNQGFPKANNEAIRIAGGEFIFLLNPDTVLHKDVLDGLIEYMKKNDEASVLAPCLLNTDGTLQYSIQRFIRIWDIIFETFYLHLLFRNRRSYYNKPIISALEVEAASGAALLVRRDVFNRVGLLDEDLFWTEDMEFCYRANKHGLKIIYLPDVKVTHHGGASGKKYLKVMISNQVLTKITFFKKNHSNVEFSIVWFFRLLHILSRIVILFFVSMINSSYKEKYSAYMFTFNQFKSGKY